MRQGIAEKVSELAETVALKRAGKNAEARTVMLTDRGKNPMDRVRNILQGEAVEVDRQLLASIEVQRANADLLRWLIAGGGISSSWLVVAPPGQSTGTHATCFRPDPKSKP